MTVLLTGGAGYIGSHTLVELLNGGHDAIVVDDFSNSHPNALTRVRAITGRDFRFYEMNVCDTAALEKVFSENAIDCVMHFAGRKAVGESVRKPRMYYRNNLDSTIALCEAMERHGVKRFVFSSSATVYLADGAEMPLTEESPRGCINPYGWTKYMCEQILRDVAAARPDWSVVLLRYFNPIGAHASGQIGEDPAGIPNNLMPYITQTALGRLEKLTVFGDDYPTHDGTGVRDYIHVVDLALGHVAALNYAIGHTGAVAINLGTGVGYSVLDIVRAFEKINGVRVPYTIGPRRPGDPATVYSNADRAEALLKWRATRSLEDMCRDSWRWQTQNPRGY